MRAAGPARSGPRLSGKRAPTGSVTCSAALIGSRPALPLLASRLRPRTDGGRRGGGRNGAPASWSRLPMARQVIDGRPRSAARAFPDPTGSGNALACRLPCALYRRIFAFKLRGRGKARTCCAGRGCASTGATRLGPSRPRRGRRPDEGAALRAPAPSAGRPGSGGTARRSGCRSSSAFPCSPGRG